MQKLFRILHILEDTGLLVILASLVVFSALQIILRNVGVAGFLWAEDASKAMVLWLAFFGAMRASRQQSHISIDLISHYSSKTWQKINHFWVSIASAIICFIAAYYCIIFVYGEYQYTMEAFLNIPTWAIQAIIPFSLSVIGLRLVFHSLTPKPENDDQP